MLKFEDKIESISSVGVKIAKKLQLIGINTVGDLLYYFPFRYEDFSQHKNINELNLGDVATIKGVIEKIKTSRTFRKRMSVTEAYLSDGSGSIKAVWFNYMLPLKFLSKGKAVQLSGKVSQNKKGEPFFQHPNFEIISRYNLTNEKSSTRSGSTGILSPVYSETKNLNSYWFRRIIKNVLAKTQVEEFIPADIVKSQNLIPLKKALKQIHYPVSFEEAEGARKRFAFEKMFLFQIKALQVKKSWESNQAVPVAFDEKEIKSFVGSLPFLLTDGQKKTAWQIIKDLEKNRPMNRLLEGDVGSGKTVVASMAVFSVTRKGYQAAILAPTEVLAIQHYKNTSRLFEKCSLTGAILTASQSSIDGKKVSKKILLEKLKSGEIDYVIGTHALLVEKVKFKNLSLVIIDEQHRFGVKQRAYLQQETLNIDDGMKNKIPHLLTMTATPIPRTLSLAIFGNLDLSIINEFPKGRKKIITKVVSPRGREQVHQFVKQEVKKGRQAFIICPLVEESSKISEVKAATQEHQALSEKIFAEFKVGLLHGKMKSKDKDAVMADFKNKKYDILVSTSVVEVGVDIPNATVMIIEGAERFGLSQLHQFRGRVGRSEKQSYCFLFTSDSAPETTSRLKAMEETNDGFKIAEKDLKLRGPGQFLGTMQSGVPDIAMESLSDVKTIQSAQIEAQRIIAFDPVLEKFPLLKKQIDKIDSAIHWE